MKDYTQQINDIESWKDSKITIVLGQAADDKDLKKFLTERYSGILKGVNKKNLQALIGLKALWNGMNVEKRWAVIENWPQEIPFFTDVVELTGKGPNQANHEEWQVNGIDTINDAIGKLQNIKKILLRDLPLKSIPDAVGTIGALEVFEINGCGINNYKDEVFSTALSLPEGLFTSKTLKELSVFSTRITSLPNAVGNLTQLEKLTCSKTSVPTLPESISNLRMLTKLDLSHNDYLKELPDAVLGLPLTDFNIQGTTLGNDEQFVKKFVTHNPGCAIRANGLENINLEEVLDKANFKGNDTLSLRSRKLKHLPGSLAQAHNLVSLDLGYNMFETLPVWIGGLHNLETLSLSANGSLTSVPDSVGNLASLKVLTMDSLYIKSLPDTIGNLANLETLTLDYCSKLERLPDTIVNLQNLKEFWMNADAVNELPDGFENLKSLKNLKISLQLFNKYADVLQQLPSLEVLALSGEEKLSPKIGNFKGLKEFSLSFASNCTTLPEELGQLQNLTKLKLMKVPIKSVPASFSRLKNLKVLEIRDSDFVQLPEEIMGCINLEILSLPSNSKLKTLPDSVGNLTKLTNLTITHTKIETVPNAMSALVNLAEFSIVGTKMAKNAKMYAAIQKILPENCDILTTFTPVSY